MFDWCHWICSALDNMRDLRPTIVFAPTYAPTEPH
jgi:hypothetical protein